MNWSRLGRSRAGAALVLGVVAIGAGVAVAGSFGGSASGDSKLPSTEAELMDRVRSDGPNVLPELFSEKTEVRYGRCLSEAGIDPAKVSDEEAGKLAECAKAQEEFVAQWSAWLLDLGTQADGPSLAEATVPPASCLRNNGLSVDAESLRGIYPSAPAIAAVHAEAEMAAFPDSERSSLGGDLLTIGKQFLAETAEISKEPADVASALAPIRARVEDWVGVLSEDPQNIDDRGWGDVVVDAQALARQTKPSAAVPLRSLATSVDRALLASQERILDRGDAIEAESEKKARAAIESCGGITGPANPTTEQAVEWLSEHAEVTAALVGN